MIVKVGYVYDGVYEANDRWGEQPPEGVVATEIASRNQIGLWNSWTVPIGGLDPRAQGLGGWSLGIHHFYDPASQTLYRGDGTQRSAEVLDPIVMTVAGTGEISQSLFTWNHDGEIATEVGLGMVSDTVTGPDGSLYIAEPARGLLRVTPDGIINRVAGGGMDNDSEGINATDALVSPIAIAIGPDESIYISEGDRVRKVGPEGRINTIAGDGDQVYGPEGGPALGAAFEAYKIAMAPDGNLYILDYDACIIRKVDTDGMLRTYAGTEGVCGAYSGEGGRARAATFGLPMSMTLAPEGSLYVADMLANRVLRIAPNGIITTVAGTGNYGNTGDGGPAVDATLLMPMAVDVGPDNSLYIGTAGAVRKVGPDGIIVTIAGGTEADSTEDGVPAKRVAFGNIDGVQMGPDKNLYLFEQSRFWVRKIGTSFGVDSGENKISIADKDNEELYVFDGSGRHLRTTDVWSKAVLWEFDYDTDGNLMTIRDVDGDETTIDRDLYGNPTTITPPKAQPSTLAVNPDGYLTSITDPEGNTYQFTYNGDGLLTAMTNPNDHQYVFEYDSQGRLVKDINPAGGFQTLERIRLTEAEGFKVNITTAEGRMTSYETQDLPEGGKKVIKTYPFGLSKQLIWAPDSSQWIQYVDGTEIDFHQGPDPQFGMEIPIPESLTETTPAGLKRETRMAREVQLGTITDSISINDRTYTNTFDELEKRFTLTTPEGRQKTVTLNDQGRVSMMQLNTLAPINFSYNDQGKGETITIGSGSDERSFQFSYDQYGFLSSMTDPLGGMITFQRDLAGRIIGKSMPDGRTITFNYDANGNVTSVTPPGRTGHTLSYTEVDKLSTYDPPNAGFSPDATTFAYNLDGQLTGIVRPGGSSLVIGYDSSGRALSFTHSHGTTIAAYDPNHAQLTTLTTSDGVDTVIQSLTWDGFLMVGESWEGPFSASVEGSHNDLFLVKSMRVSGGAWRNFSYDNDGLMVSAGDLNMVRDENGLITETSIGTVTTKTGYDDFGERVSFISKSGTNPLIEINYVYDKLGRITGKTEVIDGQSTSYQYTYDACGRLTDVDGSSVAHYTYDENSNRTNYTGDLGDAAGAYDSQDRMLSYGDASYTYSASGELLTKTVGTDTTTYGYDSIGNLRTVTIPGGTVIDYLIDGMDRRIGKKINGTLVQGFVYMDLISPVAELDGAGTVVSEFVYGSNMNVPDYMIKGGITYRIISDHLGSPRLVVNITTGAILQRIDYDEFGRVLSDTNLGFQPFGFAGGLYDIDTGLVRFGARDYDPETGRWTTKDPILFSGGDTNLYGYVLADPINFIDPTGYALNRWQDYFNTSQVFVDAVGSVGDACLRSVTFDLFDPGKDIRKAVGVDIVNECSETYIKVGKGADIVLKTVGACSGVSGLREGITTLSKRGAVKYFQDINNTIGFAGGAANSIKTLGQ
jgi:RHS repeat-associated protein